MADTRIRRLLAFDRQIRLDRSQSPVFLHRRDRRFALNCQDRNRTPSVDHWLEHLARVGQVGMADRHRPLDAAARTPDPSLTQWRRLLTAFTLAGVVFGMVAMVGLLYYEGGQRINLTVLLAFTALQCLLALITMVQSTLNWQPWRTLLRRSGISGRGSSPAPLEPLMPVLMARVAHTGGLCFGLAGIATLLVMVVIQDLAFGWSTTLNASAGGYHQLLSALAWPWHQLWPAAVPDLALVEATRFFRSEDRGGPANPELWGQWWPFVAMVWLVYIVVPRLAGLALAQIQLQIRAGRALADHPGMVALAYRLETPTVDTGNDHHDAADSPDPHTAMQCQALPDSQILIYWAGADDPELPDSLAAGHLLTIPAGGRRSLAEDQQTIDRSSDILAKQPHPAVTLVTRAWEPPIAELEDFISLALRQWPKKTRIALLPLDSDPTQMTNPAQLSQWLRFVERLDKKRVCVSQPDLQPPESRAYVQQPEGLK